MNSQSETSALHNQLINSLNSVGEGLLTISEAAEDDFLTLGQQLQTGYTSVSELANRALEVTKYMGTDSEESDFTRARHTVNIALENLKVRRELVESKLPPVRKVVDYLDDLNSKRDEIEMIAKYLRAVALNIFIETARSEVSNQNFSIIAEEIKELSEDIIKMAKSIRDDSENAKNRFMDMYSNIADGIKTMNKLTTGAEDSVSNSIQNIKKLIDLSRQSVTQAETMSREISQQVGNIVVGVQFHDDMRQRLEHIVAALNNAAPLCEEINQSEEDADAGQLATAYSIIKVQKAQIQSIITELDEIYRKNKSSFENIIIEIAQLVQILSSGSNQTQGSDDIFAKLSLTLSNFQNLDDKGFTLVSQLGETYQQASVTTEALSVQAKQIHDISRDSHIKALNAIIATQDMGLEGRTLLTLAGEMKTLSYQAENFVTDVSEIINSIIATVKNANVQNADAETPDTVENEKISLNTIVTSISSLCTQMQNDSNIIYQQSEALNTNLAAAKTNLDFFPVIGSKLADQMETLTRAMEILSPWADAASQPLSDDLIQGTYTMEKERKIHEQALDALSGAAGSAEAAENVTGTLDETTADSIDRDTDDQEFDDNIELF